MLHRPGKTLLLQVLLIPALLFMGITPATAAEEIASFKVVSGTVEVLRNGKLPAMPVKTGDSLSEGDFVRTRSGSFAEIRFKDGTVLKVAQRSRIDIGSYFSTQKKNGANVRLPRGKVEAIVDPARVKQAGEGRRFEVHTPNAVAGVRGTDFIVSHDRNLTGVLVRQGSVYTYNRHMPDRMVTVTAGNITTISPAAPPQPPRQALPSEMQHMERGVTAAKADNGSQSASQGSGQPAAAQTSQAGQGTATETQTSGGDLLSQSAPLSTTLAPTTGSSLVSGATLTTTTTTASPASTVTTSTQPPPPPPPVVVSPISTVTPQPPPPPPPAVPTTTNVNVNVNF